jgi:hypothetical protein
VRTDADRLEDLLDACQRLERIVARGEQHFRSSDEAQLAVVPLLQIMGEAAARVSADLRASGDSLAGGGRDAQPGRAPVLRDRFRSGVETIATQDVPRLEQQIRRIASQQQ